MCLLRVDRFCLGSFSSSEADGAVSVSVTVLSLGIRRL